MLTVAPDFARRIELSSAGACPRPVDIDRSLTGFSRLVALRVYSFVADAVIDGEAESDELFIVLMRGRADVGVTADRAPSGDHTLDCARGARAVYLPPHAAYRLTARTDCDVAYVRAAPPVAPMPGARSFTPADGLLDVPDHALGMSLTLASINDGGVLSLSGDDARVVERFLHVRGAAGSVVVAGARLGDWDSAILQDGELATLAVERGTVDLLLISASAQPEHSPEHPIDDDHVGINHSKKLGGDFMPSVITARALLLAGAALLPTSAFAQDAGGAPVDAQDAAEGSTATDGDIVVTGSRIRRPDYEAPNPIVSFDAANIEESGNTNITSFLQRVPALTGSRDSTDTAGGNGTFGSFGQTGLNQLNLRNLGTNRTLVLVNNRRHVAGEANTAAVDINSIPTDLIERVDVLTGAVSAIYGADGVTGVVNFVLKRDFDGIAARGQVGISDHGDAGNRFASIVAGRNFGDGRGNVTLSYEYNADDPVGNDDRPFLRQNQRRYLIPNDADVGDDPNIPDNILVGDLRYTDISPIGAVFVGTEANPSLDGLGRPYDRGTPAAFYFTGGISTPVAGFYQGDLFPKIERHGVNLLSHYDLSDALTVSIEGKFAETTASSFGQFLQTYYYPISLDNPLLPASIRENAISRGAANVFVNRDNLDFGRQGEENRRRTYRGVIDFSGRISENATWNAYYQYGQTDIRITKINDRLGQQYAQAIDAVRDSSGRIVCNPANNPGAGCVPISLFGAGPATPEQLAYFLVSHDSSAQVTQHVASASVSGDFGALFALPGGPVQFAFGGEYRREASRFDPNDDLVNARFFSGDQPSLISPSRGSFDVKEVFGEIELPILSDLPFAHLLTIGAAGRYSNYSTVGDAETWQVNGTYAPIRSISFRGSYGRAVRAPNIGELFQPRLGTSDFFTDPCTPAQINNGTEFRAANCQTTLAAVGAVVSPGLQTGDFVRGVSSGNPDLRPEIATTWTAGVALRPDFLSGFNASVDWYDITLEGAINTVGAGSLATLCVDQPTVPNQFCDQFTRAQGTGIINGFTVGPLNVARFRTAGLDINIDYLLRTDRVGTFNLRLVAGYLDKLERIGIPGSPIDDQRNQSFAPKWTANFSPTWTLGVLSVNYNLRWVNETLSVSKNTLAANPDYAAPEFLRHPELWQHDVQMRVELDSGFALYGGVTNLTDQRPDPASFATNVPISPLGRYFYAGVRVDLGR